MEVQERGCKENLYEEDGYVYVMNGHWLNNFNNLECDEITILRDGWID